MHEVVSNTTPIISLLKIDKLDLLRQLYEYIAYSKSPATRGGITPSFSSKEADVRCQGLSGFHRSVSAEMLEKVERYISFYWRVGYTEAAQCSFIHAPQSPY